MNDQRNGRSEASVRPPNGFLGARSSKAASLSSSLIFDDVRDLQNGKHLSSSFSVASGEGRKLNFDVRSVDQSSVFGDSHVRPGSLKFDKSDFELSLEDLNDSLEDSYRELVHDQSISSILSFSEASQPELQKGNWFIGNIKTSLGDTLYNSEDTQLIQNFQRLSPVNDSDFQGYFELIQPSIEDFIQNSKLKDEKECESSESLTLELSRLSSGEDSHSSVFGGSTVGRLPSSSSKQLISSTLYRHSKLNNANKGSMQGGKLKIPPAFFEADFSISGQISSKQGIDELIEAQELLMEYLDEADCVIFEKISSRFSEFIRASAVLGAMEDEIVDCRNVLDEIRVKLKDMHWRRVATALKILLFARRRDRILDMQRRLSLLSSMRQTYNSLQLLISSQDFATAIDLIDFTRLALRDEMKGIHATKLVSLRLEELGGSIDRLLRREFLHEASLSLFNLEKVEIPMLNSGAWQNDVFPNCTANGRWSWGWEEPKGVDILDVFSLEDGKVEEYSMNAIEQFTLSLVSFFSSYERLISLIRSIIRRNLTTQVIRSFWSVSVSNARKVISRLLSLEVDALRQLPAPSSKPNYRSPEPSQSISASSSPNSLQLCGDSSEKASLTESHLPLLSPELALASNDRNSEGSEVEAKEGFVDTSSMEPAQFAVLWTHLLGFVLCIEKMGNSWAFLVSSGLVSYSPSEYEIFDRNKGEEAAGFFGEEKSEAEGVYLSLGEPAESTRSSGQLSQENQLGYMKNTQNELLRITEVVRTSLLAACSSILQNRFRASGEVDQQELGCLHLKTAQAVYALHRIQTRSKMLMSFQLMKASTAAPDCVQTSQSNGAEQGVSVSAKDTVNESIDNSAFPAKSHVRQETKQKPCPEVTRDLVDTAVCEKFDIKRFKRFFCSSSSWQSLVAPFHSTLLNRATGLISVFGRHKMEELNFMLEREKWERVAVPEDFHVTVMSQLLCHSFLETFHEENFPGDQHYATSSAHTVYNAGSSNPGSSKSILLRVFTAKNGLRKFSVVAGSLILLKVMSELVTTAKTLPFIGLEAMEMLHYVTNKFCQRSMDLLIGGEVVDNGLMKRVGASHLACLAEMLEMISVVLGEVYSVLEMALIGGYGKSCGENCEGQNICEDVRLSIDLSLKRKYKRREFDSAAEALKTLSLKVLGERDKVFVKLQSILLERFEHHTIRWLSTPRGLHRSTTSHQSDTAGDESARDTTDKVAPELLDGPTALDPGNKSLEALVNLVKDVQGMYKVLSRYLSPICVASIFEGAFYIFVVRFSSLLYAFYHGKLIENFFQSHGVEVDDKYFLELVEEYSKASYSLLEVSILPGILSAWPLETYLFGSSAESSSNSTEESLTVRKHTADAVNNFVETTHTNTIPRGITNGNASFAQNSSHAVSHFGSSKLDSSTQRSGDTPMSSLSHDVGFLAPSGSSIPAFAEDVALGGNLRPQQYSVTNGESQPSTSSHMPAFPSAGSITDAYQGSLSVEQLAMSSKTIKSVSLSSTTAPRAHSPTASSATLVIDVDAQPVEQPSFAQTPTTTCLNPQMVPSLAVATRDFPLHYKISRVHASKIHKSLGIESNPSLGGLIDDITFLCYSLENLSLIKDQVLTLRLQLKDILLFYRELRGTFKITKT